MTKLGVSALNLCLRRFPFEAGRWRLIPYALRNCQRTFTYSCWKTVRTRHGFRMRVDVSDWLGRHIFVTGEYEPATTALVASCVEPGDCFLDIGANAGYFTLLGSKLVGSKGKVLSFEPVPSVRSQLEANIQLNAIQNCEVFDVALSNQAGSAEFFAGPKDHMGVSSLRPLEDASEKLTVRTAKLDDFTPDQQRIDFIKIDVEGAEAQVLEGMLETLNRWHPHLVVEITPSYLADMNRSPGDIDDLLSPLGYKAFEITHQGLKPIQNLSLEGSSQYNAFFTTNEKLAARHLG